MPPLQAWFRLTARVIIATSPERPVCRSGDVAKTTCVGKQNHLSDMSFRPERSGVEESTTLEDGPTQDKACYLSRFLDSHSFARNDMSICDSIQPHGLYSGRCMAMNHRRYIAWYRSTAQVIIATWRAADCRPYRPSWGNTVFPHRFYSLRSRNGTQAVPYGFAERFLFLTNAVQKRPFFTRV